MERREYEEENRAELGRRWNGIRPRALMPFKSIGISLIESIVLLWRAGLTPTAVSFAV